MSSITETAATLLRETGFEHFGFAKLETPMSFAFYEEWIEQELHGEMSYLANHLNHKKNPTDLMKDAKVAIVVTQPYLPHPAPNEKSISLRTALYSQGDDYHFWFKNKLSVVAESLRQHFPNDMFLPMTDSAPVLERDLAYRAGLGWIGKNTCLLNTTRGSLFFIGEIYSSLDLKVAENLHADRCGKCTRCIDACPTQALVAPRRLDARKCISYLTIEAKSTAEESMLNQVQDWFFGCDICQTVCPWNEKVFGEKLQRKLEPKDKIIEDLRFILTASNKLLQKHFQNSALSRAGANGLKRNAVVVSANLGLIELLPEIRSLSENKKLTSVIDWCIKKMT